MKILIITGGDKRHFYLCQKIIEFFPSDELHFFVNTKHNKEKRLRNRFLKLNMETKIRYFRKYILHFFFYPFIRIVHAEYKNEQNAFFKKDSKTFEKYLQSKNNNVKDFNKLNISLNSQESINLYRDLAPNVTIVMGSALLSNNFLANSGFILNIHTGLSPYYRGGCTNFWPIINLQPNFCGYTIHQMSNGIDAGPIICSESLDARDYELCYPRINNVAIVKAIKRLPDIVNNINSIKVKKQLINGLQFRNLDFNGLACFKYYLIRRKYLKSKSMFRFDDSYPKTEDIDII